MENYLRTNIGEVTYFRVHNSLAAQYKFGGDCKRQIINFYTTRNDVRVHTSSQYGRRILLNI